jgi:hypothetical protein
MKEISRDWRQGTQQVELKGTRRQKATGILGEMLKLIIKVQWRRVEEEGTVVEEDSVGDGGDHGVTEETRQENKIRIRQKLECTRVEQKQKS